MAGLEKEFGGVGGVVVSVGEKDNAETLRALRNAEEAGWSQCLRRWGMVATIPPLRARRVFGRDDSRGE